MVHLSADNIAVPVQSKHYESERELQRHQESYMRREQQLQARLAELEQRLQHTAGPASADSTAADADEADAGAEPGAGHEQRIPSSRSRRPPKDQPLTLETVQNQVTAGAVSACKAPAMIQVLARAD
jgi:hypothetical protein